jgi:hydrogenase maturation factor
MWWQ